MLRQMPVLAQRVNYSENPLEEVTVTGQRLGSRGNPQFDLKGTPLEEISELVVEAARTGYLAKVKIDFKLKDPNEQIWAVYAGNQWYYLTNNSGKSVGNVGKNGVFLPKQSLAPLDAYVHTHPNWATQPGPGSGDFGKPFPVYGISPFGTWVIYPGASSETWLWVPH